MPEKTAIFFQEFDGKSLIFMRFCVQEFESGKRMKPVASIRALKKHCMAVLDKVKIIYLLIMMTTL